jgi:hypothetical protein
MHPWRLVLLCTISPAAFVGCKTAPYVNSHIETVNAEYRQLEDYVYSLEDENSRLQHELDAIKAGRPADGASPRRPRSGVLQRPSRMPSDDLPDLDVPSIEVPGAPADTPPRRSNRPDVDTPPEAFDLSPPTVELPAPAPATGPTEPTPAKPTTPEALPPAKPADAKVTHLFLNPVLTGGSDLDGQAGDDGLCVVIEPRNAADEYVPQAGAVSIVVLDPTQAGDAARVARWNFDLAATQQKLTARTAARGIQLQMPWPATAPAADKLHLFVRYETADGRRLQTDREIFLAQPGQLSQRWTPRQGPREPLPVAAAATALPLAAPPSWSPFR